MKRALILTLMLLVSACKEEVTQDVTPVALGPDTTGYFCQMTLPEHPGPKGQVHLEGLPGAPLFFSQVRDTIAYQRMPSQDAPDPCDLCQRHGRAGRDPGEPRRDELDFQAEDAFLCWAPTWPAAWARPRSCPLPTAPRPRTSPPPRRRRCGWATSRTAPSPRPKPPRPRTLAPLPRIDSQFQRHIIFKVKEYNFYRAS